MTLFYSKSAVITLSKGSSALFTLSLLYPTAALPSVYYPKAALPSLLYPTAERSVIHYLIQRQLCHPLPNPTAALPSLPYPKAALPTLPYPTAAHYHLFFHYPTIYIPSPFIFASSKPSPYFLVSRVNPQNKTPIQVPVFSECGI